MAVRIFVLGDAECRAALKQWLRSEVFASVARPGPTAFIALPGDDTSAAPDGEVPTLAMDEALGSLEEQDIVVVGGVGPRFDAAIGALLRNLFDGHEVLRSNDADHRFLQVALRCYIGQTEPIGHGRPIHEAGRFDIQPLEAGRVPAHKLFIVNSTPKSDTLRKSAMLETLLGVRAREQITISHIGDLEQDWSKRNYHAALTLVRDLRAVVVSWFRHDRRTDEEFGFRTARYPTIESFYWHHFLGTVRTSRLFYGGKLERWLDHVAASYIPILRFEDLVS